MHHYYITPGVDGSKMHQDANRRFNREDQDATVHEHAHGQPCNDECVVYSVSNSINTDPEA